VFCVKHLGGYLWSQVKFPNPIILFTTQHVPPSLQWGLMRGILAEIEVRREKGLFVLSVFFWVLCVRERERERECVCP
jgi:hypothetical protein